MTKLALASLLLLAASGCSSEQSAPGRYETLPNILMVTVDTLRADHLSCYGYPRETSPRMDALAAEGLLFENAVSTSGATVPSHLSLLTGLFVHQHGFHDNWAITGNPVQSVPGRRFVTEFLQDAGYTTVGIVSSIPIGTESGFDKGFDHFFEPEDKPTRLGDSTNADFRAWLESYTTGPRDEPFFLWMHYWNVHDPNLPAEPYASLFASDAEQDELIERLEIDPGAIQREIHAGYVAMYFFHELYLAGAGRKPEIQLPELGQDDIRGLLNRYDGDVRAVDDLIGEVIDGLVAKNLWDNTICVVTADHGQSLGQHNWLGHELIHGELIEVPLIMRFPEQLVAQPRRLDTVVSLIDVLPTVLSRIQAPELAGYLSQSMGGDLLDPAFDRPFAFSQRAYRPGEDGSDPEVCLTVDGWRYYKRSEEELYNLSLDPGQLENVAAANPELLLELRELTQTVLADAPRQAEHGGDGEEASRMGAALNALGYGGDAETGKRKKKQ